MTHFLLEQNEIFEMFTPRGYMKSQLKNAVRGQFMAEELNKLSPSADFVEIYEAKERANLKAEMMAEIMMSEMNAMQLKDMFDNIVNTTQKFTKKHK